MTPLRPTTAKERHVVLDALRGMALLGIALANFPEFALWTFLSADEQSVMPTAGVDSGILTDTESSPCITVRATDGDTDSHWGMPSDVHLEW